MGFFDGYDIASSGMAAQRTRINVVSSNIANAQTTHTQDGGPYRKQNVVFKEVLLHKANEKNGFGDTANSKQTPEYRRSVGVNVQQIAESKQDNILRYEPNHPDANKDGYVAYPNINPVIEMTDLIEAMRSYEANLSAFQTQKNMDNKTIDLLKG
jgi:flagellar basal-body rod protein FlgC